LNQHATRDAAADTTPLPGTSYLTVDGGRIAYQVAGRGPLIVLAHGMGHSRAAYRFVAPRLIEAGYRVASADLRGCGESTATWPSYTRTDIAGDLISLIRHLGGPAALVGHSIAGGAATIAAAQAHDLITGIVEIAPFTRAQAMQLSSFKSKSYRQGAYRMAGTMMGSVPQWLGYLDHAYPGPKPGDWTERQAGIEAGLREPGRMKALQAMLKTSPADAGARLADVRCPALIIEGSLDPDWADPRAEGEAIVAALPAGVGQLQMIDGAGHYPHDQYPDRTATLILSFLRANAGV
jgi:pimeloyl-ACP methyl ester carboxylesterase